MQVLVHRFLQKKSIIVLSIESSSQTSPDEFGIVIEIKKMTVF